MKRTAGFLLSVTTALKKTRHRSLAVLLALLVVIGILATIPAVKGHGKRHAASKSPQISADLPAQEKAPQSAKTQPAAEQSATATATTATPPAIPANSSQKSLIISPSTFTVTPGSSPSISMQSSNGKAINMPLLSTNANGKLMLLFLGSPAKPSWSGPLAVLSSATRGTYTIDVIAQDSTAAYYRGTITVHIIQPTMNISVQSQGYDAENDALAYIIKLNRIDGFSEPVTKVNAWSMNEDGLGCHYTIIDDSTIAMACGQGGTVRPTNGTLMAQVTTASVSSSASIGYSLPALP